MYKFKTGDRVKVAENAAFYTENSWGGRYYKEVPARARGKVGTVMRLPNHLGNYVVRVEDASTIPLTFYVLDRYLTAVDSDPFSDLPEVVITEGHEHKAYKTGTSASVVLFNDEDPRVKAMRALDISAAYFAIYKTMLAEIDVATEAAVDRIVNVVNVSREDALKIVEEFGLAKND